MTTQQMTTPEAPSLESIVWVDPERMGGAPCFYGTRVPIKILFDYIEGGEPLEEFLEGFPSVTREQAVAVLEPEVLEVLANIQPGQFVEVLHEDMKRKE